MEEIGFQPQAQLAWGNDSLGYRYIQKPKTNFYRSGHLHAKEEQRCKYKKLN